MTDRLVTYKPSGMLVKIDVDELLKDIFANEHFCQVRRDDEEGESVECGKPADWVWKMDGSCAHSPGQHYLCDPCHREMNMAIAMGGQGDVLACIRCSHHTKIIEKRKIR